MNENIWWEKTVLEKAVEYEEYMPFSRDGEDIPVSPRLAEDTLRKIEDSNLETVEEIMTYLVEKNQKPTGEDIGN